MRWIGAMILAMCVACADHDKIPEGIIKQPQMETILWDMVQADRYVSSFINTRIEDSPSVKLEKAAVMYEQVFRLHKISRDEFLKSYRFYLSRPDITRTMFDSIASRADRQRDRLYRSTTPAKSALLSKRDSLLRVDSIRRADSIEKIELAKPSTEELFADSVLDKKQ